jgi:hypothetical protein
MNRIAAMNKTAIIIIAAVAAALALAACGNTPAGGSTVPGGSTASGGSAASGGGNGGQSSSPSCTLYDSGHDARVVVLEGGQPECTTLASSLSTGGDFWTSQYVTPQDQLVMLCVFDKGSDQAGCPVSRKSAQSH